MIQQTFLIEVYKSQPWWKFWNRKYEFVRVMECDFVKHGPLLTINIPRLGPREFVRLSPEYFEEIIEE